MSARCWQPPEDLLPSKTLSGGTPAPPLWRFHLSIVYEDATRALSNNERPPFDQAARAVGSYPERRSALYQEPLCGLDPGLADCVSELRGSCVASVCEQLAGDRAGEVAVDFALVLLHHGAHDATNVSL